MQDTFKRGQDPKKAMGIGEGVDGFILTDMSHFNSKKLLEGFLPSSVYVIKHVQSSNTMGFCSGRKSSKVIREYFKKSAFSDWENRWIWKSRMMWYAAKGDKIFPEGGSLIHQYKGKEKEDFWINSNHDITFSKQDNLIMEI